MQAKKVNLFGISFDNLDMDETITAIMCCIGHYQKDHKALYISTVNTDFLANMLSWNSGKPRHPELYKIVRESAVITPDGMPIVWLSQLLGSPLKERVTGLDLVPKLAMVLGEKKMAIYLLGGEPQTAAKAAENLTNLAPGLQIVGVSSPFISIKGEKLSFAQEQDDAIVEEINRLSPQVLLINLGNPKQEIWFERVRHKLRVPVSIGIGGTLDRIGGKFDRAPEWMQTHGVEWLYRLYQEPKRLWKRYCVDFFKYLYLCVPLVLFHWFTRLLNQPLTKPKKKPLESESMLFLSPQRTIAVLHLPVDITGKAAQKLKTVVQNVFEQDLVIVDFHSVKYVDLDGIEFLQEIWQRGRETKKDVFALTIHAPLRMWLKLNKGWEIIADRVCNSTDEILSRIAPHINHEPLYESVQQFGETVVLSFLGQLESSRDYENYFQKFVPLIQYKECVLDLRYCNLIENAGFSFLLRIFQHQKLQKRSFKIIGLSNGLKKQFQDANIDHLVPVYEDLGLT